MYFPADGHETDPTVEHFDDQVITQSTHALIDEVRRLNPEIEVRSYQIECLKTLEQTRLLGRTRALVHMATGLGKTTVVATDVKRYLDSNPHSRVLFLCHQKEILKQARERFESIIGYKDHSYGNFTGEEKDLHDATCLFASFQTMHGWKDYFNRDEFDYIVVDESHHGKAETYAPTLDYFEPNFMIGMTATPDRADLKNIREIFGPEVFSLNLAEALVNGYLARPDYRVILDDLQSGADLEGLSSLGDLNRKLFIPKRDEEIARIIGEKTTFIDEARTIVFCPTIEHAQRIAALLKNAKALHSQMKLAEKRQIVADFRDGKLSSVVTVDMFNEGVDIPEANVIVFLRSTKSETIFLQQLGRGLRKLPGKDEVLILDFVANCDRLLMIQKLLHNIQQVKKIRSHEAYEDEATDTNTVDLYDINFNDLAPLFTDLTIGRFEFNETSRKILELIQKLQQRQESTRVKRPEEAISYYSNLCTKLGKIATIEDIRTAADEMNGLTRWRLLTAFNGSLKLLREAAGYNWPANQCAQAYQEISERIGRPATPKDITDFRTADQPGYRVLVRPFGNSFAKLKIAAGYESSGPKKSWPDWDLEDAIKYYQEISEELGRPARIEDINNAAKNGRGPTFIALERHCEGSVAKLRVIAGYNALRKEWRGMSKEDAIVYYSDLCKKLGKVASVVDVVNDGQKNEGPSLQTLTKHFDGKIHGLKHAAGFKPRERAQDWGPNKSLEYYINLYIELGRWPTGEDIRYRSAKNLGPNINIIVKHYDKKLANIKLAAAQRLSKQQDTNTN